MRAQWLTTRGMCGDEWDSQRVIAGLVEAFRRMPDRPIYSPAQGVLLESVFFQRPIDGGELIVATGHYLGFRSTARRRLLAYCRAKGTGEAVRHLCLAHGWPASSLYRHVTAAAANVAEGLNRDRQPPLGSPLGPESAPPGSIC